MKKNVVLAVVSAVLVVVAVLVQLRMWQADSFLAITLVSIVAALAFAYAQKYAAGKPDEDEMTQRINEKSIVFSWWAMFALIAVFSFMAGEKMLTFTMEEVLSSFFVALIATYLAAQAYYQWRGV